MSEILLLGPAKSRSRLLGSPFTGDRDNLWVVEKDDRHKPAWTDARYFVGDLNEPTSIRLPTSHFDEIHAYEILNLLPGPPESFFSLWRWMWEILAPAGQVIASTPHWQSRWIHAYPGPQRTYTPELLSYLGAHKDVHCEDFSVFWPRHYRFEPIFMADSEDKAAFYFRLAKC